MKKCMPKSTRKFIRLEKARIRREVLDVKEQEALIIKLYEKTARKPKEEKKEEKPVVKKKEPGKKESK